MSYASYSDLREKYHPGQTLDCVLKEYDRASGRMVISVKEAAPRNILRALAYAYVTTWTGCARRSGCAPYRT